MSTESRESKSIKKTTKNYILNRFAVKDCSKMLNKSTIPAIAIHILNTNIQNWCLFQLLVFIWNSKRETEKAKKNRDRETFYLFYNFLPQTKLHNVECIWYCCNFHRVKTNRRKNVWSSNHTQYSIHYLCICWFFCVSQRLRRRRWNI